MSDYATRLQAAKQDSTLQLLFKCARLLNEHALATYPQADPMNVARPAHLALFPHIDLERGTRVTEIAARLGITKQGVGQLVDDLEGFGVVARVPDPEDRRAKRVVFTEQGKVAMLTGLGHLKAIEKQLSGDLGKPTMGSLHRVLCLLLDHIETSARFRP